MSSEPPTEDDRAAGDETPGTRGTRDDEGRKRDEELRAISEHVRRVQLDTEARILARWRRRGLFGLTTSTG